MPELTAKQEACAQLLACVGDPRSKEERAVVAGYTPNYIWQLLRKPHFTERVKELARENIAHILPDANDALKKAIEGGDVKAIELAYKAAGLIATGGNTQVVKVEQNNAGTLEDGMDSVEKRRRKVLEAME